MSIRIEVDQDVFNATLAPNETTQIKVYATISQNKYIHKPEEINFTKVREVEIREIPNVKVTYECETIYGTTTIEKTTLDVFEVSETGIISPLKDGGIAEVTVTVEFEGGDLAITKKKFINRPFYKEYEKTLTMKLFLNSVDESNQSQLCTFEEALNLIKEVNHLTRGIPKIIYLVGWQDKGHDHQWPDWSVVDEHLKCQGDQDGITSLRWLINEAKKYNTIVSLHLNMFDISVDSPLLEEYIERDILARNLDGSLREKVDRGVISPVINHYMVSYTREWEEGLAQRRIDTLLEMVPELVEGGTIHIDAFHSYWFDSEYNGHQTISPYHAKKYGIYEEQETETQRKIFEYCRKKGIDITSEGVKFLRTNRFIGLQPMAWWGISELNQMEIPAQLYTGGQGNALRYGENLHGEDIFRSNMVAKKDPTEGFLGRFCLSTLQFQYLNSQRRIYESNGTVHYTNNITATDDLIKQDDVIIREGGNVFTPALWKELKEIIAYSNEGYVDREWKMPKNWEGISKVDIYEITKYGRRKNEMGRQIREGKLNISLSAGQAISIVPTKLITE